MNTPGGLQRFQNHNKYLVKAWKVFGTDIKALSEQASKHTSREDWRQALCDDLDDIAALKKRVDIGSAIAVAMSNTSRDDLCRDEKLNNNMEKWMGELELKFSLPYLIRYLNNACNFCVQCPVEYMLECCYPFPCCCPLSMSTLMFAADTHARYCKYSDLAGLFCDGGNVHVIAAKQSIDFNAIVVEVLESLFAWLYSAINDKALKITAKRERERVQCRTSKNARRQSRPRKSVSASSTKMSSSPSFAPWRTWSRPKSMSSRQ